MSHAGYYTILKTNRYCCRFLSFFFVLFLFFLVFCFVVVVVFNAVLVEMKKNNLQNNAASNKKVLPVSLLLLPSFRPVRSFRCTHYWLDDTTCNYTGCHSTESTCVIQPFSFIVIILILFCFDFVWLIYGFTEIGETISCLRLCKSGCVQEYH